MNNQAWQEFLAERGFLNKKRTFKQAVMLFQKSANLEADGIIGNDTLLEAVKLGYEGDEYPIKPNIKALSPEARRLIFGRFKYVKDGTEGNIKIVDDWEDDNLSKVFIPQLKRHVVFHRKAASQLIKLFADWEKAGLMNRIITWDGSFNPRFQRGSTSILSNHAFATAFDINAEWNSYHSKPAQVGHMGCVRELVPIAYDNGFFWGGHFMGDNVDAMHFEVYKIIK